MDAKSFGVFLAQQRKKQGFTQAELAEQLHVTDKAVSRWERGIGLPDINTLEPLANALQMTLDELIHAEIKQERSTASAVQAFVDLFSPQSQSVWRTIRSTCFILSAALCIVALALCPGNVAIQWKVNFFAVPIAYAGKFVVFPALALLEAGTLYFWKFCDAHISLQEKHLFDVVLYSSSALRRICEVASRSNFPVLLWLSYPFLCTYDPVVKYSSFLTLPNSNKNPAT